MGLTPPFGVKATLANKFINKALDFKPNLVILIVPKETQRYIIFHYGRVLKWWTLLIQNYRPMKLGHHTSCNKPYYILKLRILQNIYILNQLCRQYFLCFCDMPFLGLKLFLNRLDEKTRPNKYDLIWEDPEILRGQVFLQTSIEQKYASLCTLMIVRHKEIWF